MPNEFEDDPSDSGINEGSVPRRNSGGQNY